MVSFVQNRMNSALSTENDLKSIFLYKENYEKKQVVYRSPEISDWQSSV